MSKRQIGEASLILAGSTLAINVLQIVRLMIISAWFGASTGILDKYFVALSVPLAIQGVVLGALHASFIPVYVGHLSRGEEKEAERLLASTLGFGVALIAALAVGLWFAAEPLLKLAAPGLSDATLVQSSEMFRVILITLLTGGIADLISGFFYAHKRYFFPALAPVLSVVVSTAYLLVFRKQGVYALVYGQIVATTLQLAIVAWGCSRWGGFRLLFSWAFATRYYRPIYAMMLPIGASLFLANANQLVDQAVASRLGEGAVSVLYYAGRMHDVVIKLFVLSVGGALLPFLSQYVAEGRLTELRSTLSLSNRLAFLILIPAAVAIYCFGSETVAIVFQSGRFSEHDSRLVGITWAAYSSGCFLMAATIAYGRALNAMQHLRPLLFAGVVGILLNIGLDLLLSYYLGVPGIALATPLVYLFYSIYYQHKLAQKLPQLQSDEPTTARWRFVAGVSVFIAVAMALTPLVSSQVPIGQLNTMQERLAGAAWVAGAMGISTLVYGFALKALRVPELDAVLSLFGRLLRLGAGRSSVPAK